MAKSPRLNTLPVKVLLGLVLGLYVSVEAQAAERVRMVEPSPAEDLVGSLTKSLETACNNRDVIGFLGHFTPQQRAKIRRRIENQFICQDIEMEVQDTLLLSESDTTIVFGVRYRWHDRNAPTEVFASRVTARKTGDAWLFDAEEILSSPATAAASQQMGRGDREAVGGRPAVQERPDWVPPGIEWAPGGCANGRCGL